LETEGSKDLEREVRARRRRHDWESWSFGRKGKRRSPVFWTSFPLLLQHLPNRSTKQQAPTSKGSVLIFSLQRSTTLLFSPRMATSLPLPTPTDFSFPYATPYPIQDELMQLVYHAIETKKIAIVQSPTGTVRRVSLPFSSLDP
jgi:hypothetical protein